MPEVSDIRARNYIGKPEPRVARERGASNELSARAPAAVVNDAPGSQLTVAFNIGPAHSMSVQWLQFLIAGGSSG